MARFSSQGGVGKRFLSFDKAYDYCVPESLRERARPGCRVSVPFGRGNQKRFGMLFSLLRKNRPVGSSSFPACWMKSLF